MVTGDFEIAIAKTQDVPASAAAEAADILRRCARAARAPIQWGRAMLSMKAGVRPAVAKAALGNDDEITRAHVAAATVPETLEALDVRLNHQFDPPQQRLEFHRRSCSKRPEFLSLAAPEREIVRRKTYAPVPTTIDGAVATMLMLDHDVHLFVDACTRRDTVIADPADGTIELFPSRVLPEACVEASDFVLRPSDARPPTLTLAQAQERIGGDRFLFFIDATLHRGCLLYSRYDGHIGLVVPEQPWPN